MRTCKALNCNVKSGQGYGLFRFPPDDEKRRKIWAINAGLGENYKPKLRGRICICEKHFESNQFANSTNGDKRGVRILKRDAIPTLFDRFLEEDAPDKQQKCITKKLKLANGGSVSTCTCTGTESAENTDSNSTVFFDQELIKAEITRMRSLQKETGDSCLLKFSRKFKFLESMSKHFYKMQQEGTYCNVRLMGSDGSVFAHKLVLMTCESPLLQSAFVQSKTLNQHCLNLNFRSFSYNVLEALIKYIYTGEIQIGKNGITYLFRLFKWLKLDEACHALEPFCQFSLEQPNLVNMLQHVAAKINNNECNSDKTSNSSVPDQTRDGNNILQTECDTFKNQNSSMMPGVNKNDMIPNSIVPQRFSNAYKTPCSAALYEMHNMDENFCTDRTGTADKGHSCSVQSEMTFLNKSTIPNEPQELCYNSEDIIFYVHKGNSSNKALSDLPYEMIDFNNKKIVSVQIRNPGETPSSYGLDETSNIYSHTIPSRSSESTSSDVPFDISNVKDGSLSVEIKNPNESMNFAVLQELSNEDNAVAQEMSNEDNAVTQEMSNVDNAVAQEMSNLEHCTMTSSGTEVTGGCLSLTIQQEISTFKQGAILETGDTGESRCSAVLHEVDDVNKGTVLSEVVHNTNESLNSTVKHEMCDDFEGVILPVELSNECKSTSSALMHKVRKSNDGRSLTDAKVPDIFSQQFEELRNNEEAMEESSTGTCFLALSTRCAVNDHIYSKTTCKEKSSDKEAEAVFPGKIIFENKHVHTKTLAYNGSVKSAEHSENCASICSDSRNLSNVEVNELCQAMENSAPNYVLSNHSSTKTEQETTDVSYLTKLKPNLIHVFDNESGTNFVIKMEVNEVDDFSGGKTHVCNDNDTILQTE